MYLKWAMKELKPEYTPKMKSLLKQAFDDSPKGQCDELINWYLTSTCGGTDASKFDLSQANCFSYEFPNIYKEFCKKYGFKEMKDTKFKNNLGRVIKERGFKVTREKDTKKGNLVYDFIHFDELDNSKK